MMAVFDRGDIVRVRLDPVEGHEMRGDARPALVLTTRDVNRLGDAVVAPITQGGEFSRFAGFAVSLTGAGCKTQGIALVNKMRMMDLATRIGFPALPFDGRTGCRGGENGRMQGRSSAGPTSSLSRRPCALLTYRYAMAPGIHLPNRSACVPVRSKRTTSSSTQ